MNTVTCVLYNYMFSANNVKQKVLQVKNHQSDKSEDSGLSHSL